MECEVDYVGLWWLANSVRELLPANDPSVIDETLALLGPPLEAGRIIAGQFGTYVFEEWKISPAEIISEIKREWTELGRDPDIGEIVWFVAPWRH